MNDLLPFVIIGLTSGAIYGLAGVGLVLTYKTSGIFNFGHGAIAAMAAFLFYELRDVQGMPWPVALVLCGVVFAVVMAFGLEWLSRAVAPAPTTTKVLTTIGIVLIALSAGALLFPGPPRAVAPFLPTESVEIAGVFVGYNQLIIFAVSVLATAALTLFFRRSRLGVSMRAVVEDPELLARTGTNAVVVRRAAWSIGTSFAAVSGIALVPDLGLNALTLTLLVIQAFGAAAIGGFSSLPLTYVGGLIIGVAGSLSTKYTTDYPELGGLPPSIPFLVLVVVLVLTPRRRLVERAQALPVRRTAASWRPPVALRAGGALVGVVVLIVVPSFAGIRLGAYSSMLVQVMLILSLSLLVRTSGQVSLGHMAFAAVGASTMGHLTGDHGFPWWLGLLLAGLVAVPIGAAVAIPAIRLSGTFLAVATLGFGILLEQLVYPLNIMFSTDQSGIATPRPDFSIGPWELSSDKGFYYVLLLFALGTAVLLQVLKTRPLGRLLGALHESPLALRTQGSSTSVSLVLAFVLSAVIASTAGALSASLSQYAVGTEYTSFSSLLLFAVVAVIAVGDPWNAFLGAAALTLIPAYAEGGDTATYLQLAFGIAALLSVFTVQRSIAVPLALQRLTNRLARRGPLESGGDHPPAEGGTSKHTEGNATPVEHRRARADADLQIEHLQVRFGGVVAVQDVTLAVPPGSVIGLIGPNGAGKTTIFNAATGLLRPTGGTVSLGERALTRLSTERRAQAGLGRSFQQPQLFDRLTVEENVALGAEAYLTGSNPLRQVLGVRGHRQKVRRAAREAIELVGIADLRQVPASDLSVGQRRLVELARTVSAPFSVLLLDEPSSGLDREETVLFGQTLQRLAREHQLGILLVEHDMELVRAVCERIYVLDFGKLIFEGSVRELDTSAEVRAAYLGDEQSPAPVS